MPKLTLTKGQSKLLMDMLWSEGYRPEGWSDKDERKVKDERIELKLEGWEEFRQVWPRGRWKDGARAKKLWIARGCHKFWRIVVEDVKARARDDRSWREGFIPMPSTYLNQKRWEDEIDTRQPRETQDDRRRREEQRFLEEDWHG